MARWNSDLPSIHHLTITQQTKPTGRIAPAWVSKRPSGITLSRTAVATAAALGGFGVLGGVYGGHSTHSVTTMSAAAAGGAGAGSGGNALLEQVCVLCGWMCGGVGVGVSIDSATQPQHNEQMSNPHQNK